MKLNQDLVNEYLDLAATIQFFEDARNDAYAKKIGYYTDLAEELHERMYELQTEIIEAHPYFAKRESVAIWSMDHDQLVQQFATGKVALSYNVHWGDPVDAVRLNNPTYLDMFAAADKLIRMSGDSHHVFVEGFVQPKLIKGVLHVELSTGS